MFINRNHSQTPFVHLDTKKCEACWKCIENCPSQVIGKIDLSWHKHALLIKPEACTGCLNCIDTCQYNAYSKADSAKPETEKQRKRTFNSFLVNNLLLISGLVMVFSGLVLQMGFHKGGPADHQAGIHGTQPQSIQYEQIRMIDTDKIVCGFNYPSWSLIHKIIVVIFSLLMVYHIYVHWKWYKGVITKHLIGKNKQVFILTVLFLLVAITGFIPWFIDLSGSTSIFRLIFIEIHDKLTFILIIFLLLHIIKRAGWFAKAYKKLT